MGRTEATGAPQGKLYLRRVHINSQGYDSGGAYWGRGAPLYHCYDEGNNLTLFFRAHDRDKAKEIIRDGYPSAEFYR